MPNQVCTGALMTCSFGVAPSTFNATPRPILTSNMVAGVITDNIPIMNVPPFGMCSSPSNPMVAAATAAALGVLTLPHRAAVFGAVGIQRDLETRAVELLEHLGHQ
ncbi:DUF4280 domain-containing protein, partial [Roseateles sp. GG27B]